MADAGTWVGIVFGVHVGLSLMYCACKWCCGKSDDNAVEDVPQNQAHVFAIEQY